MITSGEKQKITFFQTLIWLMPFLWSTNATIRFGIVASLFFTLFIIVFNTCIPLIFKVIINYLSACLVQENMMIQVLCISYGIAWIISQVVQRLNYIMIIPALERGQRLLNAAIFKHIHSLSMRFHVERKTGGLTNALERTHAGFEAIFWALFLFMIPTIIEMIIITGVFAYLYDITYSGILLLTTICYVVFSKAYAHKLDIIQEVHNQTKSQVSEAFVDSLLNIETVQYFHNQNREYEKFDALLQEQEKTGVRFQQKVCLFQSVQKAIIGCGLLVLTYKSGIAVLNNTMSVGDFILINSYILQFTTPLSNFGYIAQQFKKGLNDMHDIMHLLHIPPEIKNARNAQTVSDIDLIVFEDVVFGYQQERSIIKNISFALPAGKTVALVGPTGSGKSTITRLLFRFYDVSGGAILWNKQDIRNITQESLRNAIGIVAQETNLFNNTLYYNIAYGCPDATKCEVELAIERAHLKEFIAKLPDGYNTMVGERGIKLSGGEKQRIAIARVILKNPLLYIFDEATSSLDNATERALQENLKEVAAQKTTLIIAHRLSTITHADQIIVLDNGMIKERGTHAELIKSGGLYADLWRTQVRSDECPPNS